MTGPTPDEIKAGAIAALDAVLPGMPWLFLPQREKSKALMVSERILRAAAAQRAETGR